MKIAFWLSLIGILYTYAGYPVLIWLLGRLRPRPWKIAPITPSVSVVLAVHNGIALLPQKIQHLLELDYANIQEIILVSDGSTDGTAEMLAELQHPRIKTIVLEEHGGKAVAVNAGVAAATAEVILFVDIRPEIAPGAILQLVNNFADPKVGCVAGELILRQGGHDAASAAVGGIYWRYEQWIRTCESIVDSPVGVYGGFYAIRRELVTPQPAGMILDDMFQPLSIICQGYRSVLDSSAYVYDKWPEQVEGEFHRKVRTLAGNFQLFQLAPWTLSPRNRVFFQLASHKLMRLVVPYLMFVLILSACTLSTGSRIYALFAAFLTVALALAFAGLRFRIPLLHRLAAPASALLVLNAAAVVGLYKFVMTRGPLWKIWNSNQPETITARPSETLMKPVTGGELSMNVRGGARRSVEDEPVSISTKALLAILLGTGSLWTGFVLYNNIVGVKAAMMKENVQTSPFFPTGSIWTQDVSHAPLDPQSSAMIAWLASTGGWGTGTMRVDFGIRLLQANASTPQVPFHKGSKFISNDSDIVSTIPLPTEGGIEARPDYSCIFKGDDCHLLVVDREHGKLYEAFQADYEDGVLSANGLAVWDLNRVYPPSGRGDQCSSADAAGFPIAPLLFNADELATGSINHAIRFILPNPRIRANVFVHPATHAGAPRGPVTAPPYGAHFRLKASFNISKLTPAAQVVARAMQKYGMFLADGGNIALTAQNDADTAIKYSDVGFSALDLQSIKVSDFEVVDGGTPIRLTYNCVRNP